MDTKLELLTQIARGISTHFGNNCEVVIHDLRKEDLDSSIVYIENGQVSNRKLGDGPSEIVLETLKKNPDLLKDRLSYLTRTDDGRILKSSTMYIRGKDNTIDYILALNYDITGLLTIDNSLKSLLSTAETEDDEKQPRRITHNVNDLLDELIEQSVALVGKPVALMSKDDKVAAIQYLNDAGAFLITKSGDKVSNYFGISKFTLYSYMDTNKEK
ncbi:helix-turn-helix transcriptional regulator [Lacrimispora indolis]|uniref:helix-turn-helix transcriptional regulator n=1 Tax=Lacrimispora indolis TaxID=69825 RepID=UPI00041D564C|nr:MULTISPECIES: helix-turn-helix transcriptional regulator [Lachnospiraceae]